jgi:hypothetical protein
MESSMMNMSLIIQKHSPSLRRICGILGLVPNMRLLGIGGLTTKPDPLVIGFQPIPNLAPESKPIRIILYHIGGIGGNMNTGKNINHFLSYLYLRPRRLI